MLYADYALATVLLASKRASSSVHSICPTPPPSSIHSIPPPFFYFYFFTTGISYTNNSLVRRSIILRLALPCFSSVECFFSSLGIEKRKKAASSSYLLDAEGRKRGKTRRELEIERPHSTSTPGPSVNSLQRQHGQSPSSVRPS